MSIVTGFVDLTPYEARGKSAQDYLDRARWLLSSSATMVVFVEEKHEATLRAMRPSGSETIWQRAKAPEHDPRLEFTRSRSRFRWNPAKDTPRYFALMRQKLAWLRRGAELTQAPCTWVDMALCSETELFPSRILVEPAVDKIRLAELSYVPQSVRHDRHAFYGDHYWPVGGGLLRGSVSDLVWLDHCVEEEWQWCLANGFVATDEQMVGFVRFQNPERFDVYYADHPSLVHNWFSPGQSHRLILYGAMRALDDGCPAEARARIAAVLSAVS